MKRPLGWPLLSALTLWSCSDARLGDNFSEGQTKIRVLPAAFIGDVPCARGSGGGLERYVVQLQDVTSGSGDAGLEPTTSPPVPCDRAVTFAAVPGRLYGADILGFDRVIEPGDVGSVAPRWTASCGRGDATLSPDAGIDPLAPTRAVRGATVPLRGCAPFGGLVSSAQLVIDVAGALGELRCGEQAGEVGWIEAVLEGSRQLVRCGEPLSFAIATPGRLHRVELFGYELLGDAGAAEAGVPSPPPEAGAPDGGVLDAAAPDGATDAAPPVAPDAALDAGGGQGVPAGPSGEPVWQTRCTGRSLTGVSRTATCEPFARVER